MGTENFKCGSFLLIYEPSLTEYCSGWVTACWHQYENAWQTLFLFIRMLPPTFRFMSNILRCANEYYNRFHGFIFAMWEYTVYTQLILPMAWWTLTSAGARNWDWECLELAYSLFCCLEAGDKRINITANPDTVTMHPSSHQPPTFPRKTRLLTSCQRKTLHFPV